MWQFKDNKDLMGMAFIDTDIYIHTAVALKNFILIGDISHSVQLLRYKVINHMNYNQCHVIYCMHHVNAAGESAYTVID